MARGKISQPTLFSKTLNDIAIILIVILLLVVVLIMNINKYLENNVEKKKDKKHVDMREVFGKIIESLKKQAYSLSLD